jgi:alpha-beta hydrolase superfamily lysophospholipase
MPSRQAALTTRPSDNLRRFTHALPVHSLRVEPAKVGPLTHGNRGTVTMATYVLIHGAGDSAFYWHLLAPELRERGHEVVAMDLPCDDESAGLTEYTDAVVQAIGDHAELVVVAQSFGAFTAPLVCARVPVKLMVLVAGMVPLPHEKGEDWPANTGFGGHRASRTSTPTTRSPSSTTMSRRSSRPRP